MPTKPRRSLSISAKATKLGIRLRRVTNSSGGQRYGHSWLVIVPTRVTGGKRIRKQFAEDEGEQAVNFAEGQANLAKSSGHAGFKLTVAQRVEAEAAFERLEPHGLSLAEVVAAGIRMLRPAGGDVTFGKLRDDLIAEKVRNNRRPASLHSLKFYLGAIVSHFGPQSLVKTASTDSLRAWINSLQDSGSSPRHVRNFVTYSKQFFRHAHSHRFIGDNPAILLEAPHVDVKAPAILTLSEVRRLLSVALRPEHRELLPSVALSLFCGLRTEELTRLRWEAIDLKKRKITISPEIGKNRRSNDWRSPEIPKSAVEFLLLQGDRKGPVVPTRFRSRLTALHADAGFSAWAKTHSNAKRHSFGSYACKLRGIDWVVDQMGNSVRMFLKHYRNADVTKRQAQEFFKISPADLKNETRAEVVELAS